MTVGTDRYCILAAFLYLQIFQDSTVLPDIVFGSLTLSKHSKRSTWFRIFEISVRNVYFLEIKTYATLDKPGLAVEKFLKSEIRSDKLIYKQILPLYLSMIYDS